MLTYVRFYDQNAPNSISTWLCSRWRWGSLQHSPDPLAVFKGPTSKRREGKEKGKGKGGRRGKEAEGGMEEEGKRFARPLSNCFLPACVSIFLKLCHQHNWACDN